MVILTIIILNALPFSCLFVHETIINLYGYAHLLSSLRLFIKTNSQVYLVKQTKIEISAF